MKKLLSAVLIFALLMTAMPAMAQEFSKEEIFEFDIYDSFSVVGSDESVLMEIDDSLKEELEKKLFEAWEGMATEVQLYPDVMIHRNDSSTCSFPIPESSTPVSKIGKMTSK